MSEVKNLRTNENYRATAEQLIELNVGAPDRRTCRTINCMGIACRDCPMRLEIAQVAPDPSRITYRTLGELRNAISRIKLVAGVRGAPAPKDTEGVGIPTNDVHQPRHYKLFQDIESIEVIARSMTVEQFHGFCFGNILKYRLRAGKKSELANMEKDLAKAAFYETLFEQHKDKCHA